jgi:hypothetical protein
VHLEGHMGISAHFSPGLSKIIQVRPKKFFLAANEHFDVKSITTCY